MLVSFMMASCVVGLGGLRRAPSGAVKRSRAPALVGGFYRRLESQYTGPRATRRRRVRLLVETGPTFAPALSPRFDRFSQNGPSLNRRRTPTHRATLDPPEQPGHADGGEIEGPGPMITNPAQVRHSSTKGWMDTKLSRSPEVW
jgi:hypothetical protein